MKEIKEKKVSFVYDPTKPLLPYDNNCPKLKDFIVKTFSDDQLIDYDHEHKIYDRSITKMSTKELEQDLS